MSIVSGNRKRRKSDSRAHDYVSASMTAALREPSKRDIKAMLEEAAKNTAKLSTQGGNDATDH